jgi:hypothetical protein
MCFYRNHNTAFNNSIKVDYKDLLHVTIKQFNDFIY